MSPERVVKIVTVSLFFFFDYLQWLLIIKYLRCQKIINIIMPYYENMLLILKRLIHDHNQTDDCFLREIHL